MAVFADTFFYLALLNPHDADHARVRAATKVHRRYPKYDHVAVIIAEDITSRFLNVISLFNGHIPLIAVQMSAIKVGDQLSLIFTKVLDLVRHAAVDEEEEAAEITDWAYWEKKASQTTLEITDQLLGLVREIDGELALKYNKFYIGLARDGQPSNFVVFRPKKSWVWMEPRLERSDEIEAKLQQAELEPDYDTRWGRYRIQLSKGDIEKHQLLLKEVMAQARNGG